LLEEADDSIPSSVVAEVLAQVVELDGFTLQRLNEGRSVTLCGQRGETVGDLEPFLLIATVVGRAKEKLNDAGISKSYRYCLGCVSHNSPSGIGNSLVVFAIGGIQV
jgi:hypothetical protein